MNLKNRRRALHGLVGGLGVTAALGGIVGDLYSPRNALAAAFAIWIVGATLINVLTDPPS
ncbi:hypothetical protein [Pseudoruegeria sp. HB172150]|uniref:hypothetical protein n=1 Tax=Pseudoruegeria sp. HB172150 TaxID=2721164 RepID=UPI001555B2DA|nr:hypothetical protein [Pseudoruegeria sp. HB172150]